MDIRRELDLINKHFDWMYNNQGDVVVWYEFMKFSASGSVYDDVYDEGIVGSAGRKFKPGKTLPVLRVQENEDSKRAIADGRLPYQTIMIFISAKAFNNAGIENPWEYETRINDMFLWDGRYYTVTDYKLRGRLRNDVYMMVEGLQVYVDQEMVNDPVFSDTTSLEMPWPASLPILG